jgi:hypothetical protein
MIKDRAAAAAESHPSMLSAVEIPGSSASTIASGDTAVMFIVFIELPFRPPDFLITAKFAPAQGSLSIYTFGYFGSPVVKK